MNTSEALAVAEAVSTETPESDLEFLIHLARHPSRILARAQVSQRTAKRLEETGKGLHLAGGCLDLLDLEGFDLRKANLNHSSLHATNLRKANLSGASLICPAMERTNLREADLSFAYLHAIACQICDFENTDMSNVVDATGSLFHGCRMEGVKLAGAVLSGTTFYQCILERADFRSASLQGASINECIMESATLSGAQVSQVTITKSFLASADFSRCAGSGLVLQRLTSLDKAKLEDSNLPNLRMDGIITETVSAKGLHAPNADFADCRFGKSDFGGSNLAGSRWTRCGLDGINLQNANMEETSFARCSGVGADLRGVMAENVRFLESNFSRSDMRNFSGRCAYFRDCDFAYSDFTNAYLYRGILTGDPPKAMSLRNCQFVGANLVQSYLAADFSDADLTAANCTYARLNQSSFRDARLVGISLYEASMVKTDFKGATLSFTPTPFFADRCTGMSEAMQSMPEGDLARCDEYLAALKELVGKGNHGST